MKTLYLLFSEGETLPQKGKKVLMCGLGGPYQVYIQQVLSQRKLRDGATLLKVRAIRHRLSHLPPHALADAHPTPESL